MEVVLLWLDDLDDALFCVALAWERLRRIVLSIGFSSSLALAVCELTAIATQWSPAFSYVAAASVASWFGGVALRALYRGELSRSITPA
jgi:hypothetical protein